MPSTAASNCSGVIDRRRLSSDRRWISKRHLEGGGEAVADFAQGSRQALGRRQRMAQFVGERAAQIVETRKAERLGRAHDRGVAGVAPSPPVPPRRRSGPPRDGPGSNRATRCSAGLIRPNRSAILASKLGAASTVIAFHIDICRIHYHNHAIWSCMLHHARGCRMDAIAWSVAAPAVGSAFLASLVEIVEAFTIVLAVATLARLAAGGLWHGRGACRAGRADRLCSARSSTAFRFISFSSSSAFCCFCSGWDGCARPFCARPASSRCTTRMRFSRRRPRNWRPMPTDSTYVARLDRRPDRLQGGAAGRARSRVHRHRRGCRPRPAVAGRPRRTGGLRR